ncbi:MAG: TetR family transcriptional regulator [Coriobacteriales bacterium]|jgi:AcrR family transcriptional regulator
MPKVSKEQAQRKRDEILDACEDLYRVSSFHDVTIKDISERISLSRPSIYNYFQTIEEIFLDLLSREYDRWADDIDSITQSNDELSVEELSSEIAYSLERRRTMLRILSTNLYEIEDNSRLERLIDFKKNFKRTIEALDGCLKKFLPEMGERDLILFRNSFLPFLYGVFPFSEPTEKQSRAMDVTGVPHPPTSIYELTRNCMMMLLGKYAGKDKQAN